MEGKTTRSGLLQRANKILAESTPKFDIWATKSGFKHAGIFAPCKTEKTSSEYYFLSEVFGLSAKTVTSSVASKDFWDKNISKAFEWQCFSKDFNETTPFLELFDKKIADSINSLYFLPFNNKDNPMYFVIAEFEDEDSITLPSAEEASTILRNIVTYQRDEEQSLLNIDLCIDKGLEISPAHLFILSLKNSVEKSFQNADIERKLSKFDMLDKIEIKSHVMKSVSNAAYATIAPMFRTPNCLHIGSDGEIKIVIFAKDEPDDQIISFHIATYLTELLGDDAAKQILLLMAGICPNKKGTMSFLQKG